MKPSTHLILTGLLAGLPAAAAAQAGAATESAPAAQASTALEIVARVRAATGYDGLPESPRALVLAGSTKHEGSAATWELALDAAGHFVERIEGPIPRTRGFDGTTAWERDWNGTPAELQLGDRDAALTEVWILGGSWTAHPERLELTRADGGGDGTQTVTIAARLGVTERSIEIDTETWLPRAVRWTLGGVERSITFSDWRAEAGFRLPGKIGRHEGAAAGSIRIESAAVRDVEALGTPSLERPDARFDSAIAPRLEVRRAPTGHLLVQPTVAGRDAGWFILDTGAGVDCISARAAAELALEPIGETTAMGVGGQTSARLFRVDALTLGTVTIPDPVLMELDLSFLDGHLGVPIGGIVGYGVLAHAVFVLDLAEGAVAIHDPARYELERGDWEDLILYGRHPCVRARFEGHDGVFRIDTGAAGHGLMLHHDTVRELDLLAGRETRAGQAGGVGGMIPIRVGTLESVELGGHQVSAVEAAFTLEGRGAMDDPYTAGSVGLALIRPYDIVLDYPHRRIAFVARD